MPSTNLLEPVIFPVRDGEEPWTPEEIREQREVLVKELKKLDKKVAATDSELSDLLLQGNDGAGRDSADVGSGWFCLESARDRRRDRGHWRDCRLVHHLLRAHPR